MRYTFASEIFILQFPLLIHSVLLSIAWKREDVRQEMINTVVNNVQIIHHVARIFKRLMFIQVEHVARCPSLSLLLHSYILWAGIRDT